MIFKSILKPLKVFRLLGVITTYVLGTGLVRYVKAIHGGALALQGGIFLLSFVLALDYLRELQKTSRLNYWSKEATDREIRLIRMGLAIIAATFLTLDVTLLLGWIMGGYLWQGLVFLLMVLIVTGFLYYFVEMWEALRPYLILFEALLIVIIPPALAYYLHAQEFHRLLTMVVLGLVPAYLAYQILDQLVLYGDDPQWEARSLVGVMGWEKAMVLHNVLILTAYVLLAFNALLGFPWFLIWPVFLTLPIGLLEVWLMERVRQGQRPLWRVMRFATASVFLIPSYLLSFAFWIR